MNEEGFGGLQMDEEGCEGLRMDEEGCGGLWMDEEGCGGLRMDEEGCGGLWMYVCMWRCREIGMGVDECVRVLRIDGAGCTYVEGYGWCEV